jgi:hypothetical protein
MAVCNGAIKNERSNPRKRMFDIANSLRLRESHISIRELLTGREKLMIGKFAIGATAAVALVFAVSTAQAKTEKYEAKLDGASESPATTSKGTGDAKLHYDEATKKLTYTITYKDLSGPAVAAHFHGPADAGANAGVELPITVGPSPIKGEATLDDAKAADLAAGKWYVNLHTAANPMGEIRGQVEAKK